MNLLPILLSFILGSVVGAVGTGFYFKKKIKKMMQDPMQMAEAAGNMMGGMFPDDIEDN